MSLNCSTTFPNLNGGYCPLQADEIKRIGFTPYSDTDGTVNFITQTNAALIAQWQTLFDTYSHASDPLVKVVPSPLIYDCKAEQADPEMYEEAGYREKLRDGDYAITFLINRPLPWQIKKLKELEDQDMAIYLFDAGNRVWGKDQDMGTAGSAGTNLYPIKVQSIIVPDFKLKSRETPAQVMVTVVLETPDDMNILKGVTIADGDVTSDADFYSLIDGTATIGSPGATGCTITPKTDMSGEAIQGITYDEIIFVNAATAAETVIASADKLTYASGVYTVNEAALLTVGQTYWVTIRKSGYDIDRVTTGEIA